MSKYRRPLEMMVAGYEADCRGREVDPSDATENHTWLALAYRDALAALGRDQKAVKKHSPADTMACDNSSLLEWPSDQESPESLVCPATGAYCERRYCEDYGCAEKAGA